MQLSQNPKQCLEEAQQVGTSLGEKLASDAQRKLVYVSLRLGAPAMHEERSETRAISSWFW